MTPEKVLPNLEFPKISSNRRVTVVLTKIFKFSLFLIKNKLFFNENQSLVILLKNLNTKSIWTHFRDEFDQFKIWKNHTY